MKRVFISYSSDDRRPAIELVEHLEAAGLDVWFDQEIPGGQAWWSTILEQLRAADVVVVMVTETSVASAACQAELSYARALGKTIIPVRLGSLGPDDAPSSLQELQWIDYRTPTVEIALGLVRAAYHAPALHLPDPLPPPPAAPMSYQTQVVDRIYGSDPLDIDQQLAVIHTLRRWISTGEEPGRVVELATRFRGRDDLLASVVADADAVVADARTAAGRTSGGPRPSTSRRGSTVATLTSERGAGRGATSTEEPRADRWGGRRALPFVIAGAAALIVLGVAGALTRGDDGAPPLDTAFADTVPDTAAQDTAGEDTGSEDTSVVDRSETRDLEVPGDSEWTDAGVYLSAGDVVVIESAGVIVHDTSTGGEAGPEGDSDPELAQYNVIEGADHGALLARIGDGDPFPVGWYFELTVETEGELYFGPNDAGVGNNSGSFTVTVTHTPAS